MANPGNPLVFSPSVMHETSSDDEKSVSSSWGHTCEKLSFTRTVYLIIVAIKHPDFIKCVYFCTWHYVQCSSRTQVLFAFFTEPPTSLVVLPADWADDIDLLSEPLGFENFKLAQTWQVTSTSTTLRSTGTGQRERTWSYSWPGGSWSQVSNLCKHFYLLNKA